MCMEQFNFLWITKSQLNIPKRFCEWVIHRLKNGLTQLGLL